MDQGVCPTRQLVMATPRAVRSRIWSWRNGCKSFVDVQLCREQAGDDCTFASSGCALDDCGGDVPCCVHPMPSAGALDAAGKARYSLYMEHVGRHYRSKWSVPRLVEDGVLAAEGGSSGVHVGALKQARTPPP